MIVAMVIFVEIVVVIMMVADGDGHLSVSSQP